MKKLSFSTLIGLGMMILSIGFNLWVYRMEPHALIDPNDNTFQFALVDRTNQIWDYGNKTCSGFFITATGCKLALLTDHWVPNWAEGYNLPYYYSHVPQILIVTSYRLLSIFSDVSLFAYYHWIIYLLLALFPLSLFLSLRIMGLSWVSAGVGALLSTHLSTDGLYGLDPASFLWRGYGLSSQLFAMIWLPLALSSFYAYMTKRSALWPAVVFLIATTAAHLGIGILAFLSIGILSLGPSIQAFLLQSWSKKNIPDLTQHLMSVVRVCGITLLLLSYWIIPILLHDNYHNISFWDPVWKFDSYGAKEVIVRLLNGDLFDFGRLPILTVLACVGLIASLTGPYAPFSFLFAFWFVMYFGRTTWGPLIDLIPGMKEYHLSRFIVGLHVSTLFLIPLAADWIAAGLKTIKPLRNLSVSFVSLAIALLLVVLTYPQTIRYAAHNDVLIAQANQNATIAQSAAEELLTTLREYQAKTPGRVFAGRGGSWGKNFQIAETPYYMYLSTVGIPTVLWLPQTWSPNSDTEQYFSEDQLKDYVLYNIRYVVAPPSQEPQRFWKMLKTTDTWILYEVATDGYITSGIRPTIVSVDKQSFVNVVRLWIQSEYHKQKLYPELTFDTSFPKQTGLPNFRMLDEATYQTPDNTTHALFAEIPTYVPPKQDIKLPTVVTQANESDMVFKATVEVQEECLECIVILRQTFHPSWRATLDGKPVETMTVFPFYTAIKVESKGTHEIVFTYQHSVWKQALFIFSFLTFCCLIFLTKKR